VPNLIVSAPMDEEELRNLMFTAQLGGKGPFSIRYPRGKGVMTDWRKEFKELKIGEGRKIKDGKELAILSIGTTGNSVVKAQEYFEQQGMSIAHYDMRFVKPLDTNILKTVFENFKYIITIEDGVISGGFGSAVLEFAAENSYSATVVRLGIPDKFMEHGTQNQLYKDAGYDAEGIINAVNKLIRK